MKFRNKNNNGFTLIELMVVVAIITIGAVSALPIMVDKIMKDQAKANYQFAETLKPVIAEYFNKNDRQFPNSNSEAGIPQTLDVQFASSVTIGTNGVITVLFGNQANKNFTNNNTKIELIPHKTASSFINWECKFYGDTKYSPYICLDKGITYVDYVDPIEDTSEETEVVNNNNQTGGQ